jgi:hypothetical protein
MLFERRAYTLKPGCTDAFWDLQRQWNKPASWRPMLERNIGYFSTAAGPAECIVHLYRWDDYEDGRRRIAAISTPDRAEYFAAARALMLGQETCYLDRAPIPALTPLWNPERDWLPVSPAFGAAGATSTFAVVETVLDFAPGGVPAFWEACKKLDPTTAELMHTGLIGAFFVTTGVLHRVLLYRWHRSFADAENDQRKLAGDLGWNSFVDGYRGLITGSHNAYLRPSTVPWMRPLFEPIDWSI